MSTTRRRNPVAVSHRRQTRRTRLPSRLRHDRTGRSSRNIMALVIGFALTGHFVLVTSAVIFAILVNPTQQFVGPLNTVLMLVATSFAAVVGYVFGRQTARL